MARKGLQTFNVFIGNLPNDANERNIGKMFSPYGEISGIIVKETTKVAPPFNKFAFVKFLCEPDAEKAIKELDKTNVQGSNIVVKRAEDRNAQKKKSFGEGGGRRGIRQDAGNQDGGWICPNQECGNNNFMWRTTCNICNAPKPETSMPNDIVETGSGRGGPTFAAIEAGMEKDTQFQRETILITFVETPITLWIQTVSDENTKKIFNITEQLAQLCPAAQPLTGQPDPSKVYGCCFTEDNLWYRCQVKQNLGTDKYKIQYIDYGNTEEVTLNSLVELTPAIANVKGLATKIQLHNTRAYDLSDKKGIQFLKSLTDNQMAQLVRTRSLADGSGFYGQIYVDNFSLSESMIQGGYCQSRPSMGKSNQPPRPQMNEAGMFSEVPGPQMMGQQFPAGMKPQRDRNTVSPMGQPPPLISPLMNTQQPLPNMGFPMQIGQQQDFGREKKLQNQLSKKNQELERMRNEKDAANMQAEYMRSKVKTLQEEFSASAAKLQEDTMSKRVNTVVALAGVVRHLREQFPTSKLSCLLEEAIALCMDGERVDNSKCHSLAEVSTSLARYKAAQDEISKCLEQSELQDLIGSRNECRKELHRSLSVCLEEIEQLPLETRSKLVQETQLKLVNTYSEYLKIQVHDVPNLENVVPGFRSWKTKKDTEFVDVRTATDYCEDALQTALNQVKQMICVEAITNAEKSDVDIDDLFKTYSHALQREVNVTDLVHGKDANLVAMVIASVRKELHQEAATLENISVLHHEFTTRKLTIEPWLDKPPAFADFQENRKQLRSLKSKLRHLQADKLDLEESGDEEELDNIKDEEEKIRSQLQAALVQSDQLLTEVATLADSNFPELILQYPDLGIDSYLVFNGIVKVNRDVDHYCLKPGFWPGLHVSVFNGEPVLLQEFHIGDSEHCSKEDFMKQLVSYIGETNLIQAVFFSKSDRLAYVQSQWKGGQLIESAISSLSVEQVHNISISLAEEVVEIHARGCIHGEITPQAVILHEDNSVSLMYPDFSKLPGERVNKRYVTDGGLVFQTPELQYTSPDVLGNSADVYNLVLLIFWLYCPDHKPTSLPNGIPDNKQLNPTLQQLFDAVLSGKTATRIHAQQVHRLLQEAKPIEKVIVEPEPVRVPTPEPVASPPVIKSTDEPMEIGVFRAEDYLTEPAILPAEPQQKFDSVAGADTDNSWTTESSLSGTSSSRGNSPLDNTVLEMAECNITEAASNTASTNTIGESLDLGEEISGNLPTDLSEEDKTEEAADTASEAHTDNTENDNTENGNTEKDLVNSEQTSNNTGMLEEEQESEVTEVTGVTKVTGVTEKGAACEDKETLPEDKLKMLLDDSRTFLTSPDTKKLKSPLSSLLNMVKRSNAVE